MQSFYTYTCSEKGKENTIVYILCVYHTLPDKIRKAPVAYLLPPICAINTQAQYNCKACMCGECMDWYN